MVFLHSSGNYKHHQSGFWRWSMCTFFVGFSVETIIMVFIHNLDGTFPSMIVQHFVTFREEPIVSPWLFFSFPLFLDHLPNEQKVTRHSILRLKKIHSYSSCLMPVCLDFYLYLYTDMKQRTVPKLRCCREESKIVRWKIKVICLSKMTSVPMAFVDTGSGEWQSSQTAASWLGYLGGCIINKYLNE